jgi:hypothetical protein
VTEERERRAATETRGKEREREVNTCREEATETRGKEREIV